MSFDQAAAPRPAAPANSHWVHTPKPRVDPRLRLLCFAHAGGGPSEFAGWPGELSGDIEVAAVRLPGRGSRIRERPFHQWSALLDALVPAMSDQVTKPFVLFGHSMGAMIAYQLTARLVALGHPPRRLILAACRAPHVANFLPAIHDLPEAEFIAHLEAMGDTPPELFADDRLLRLLAPMLRADLELAETWPPTTPPPVEVPLTVVSGDEDPIAPPRAVECWSRYAKTGFQSFRVRGGHFFLRTAGPAFFEILRTEIAAAASEIQKR